MEEKLGRTPNPVFEQSTLAVHFARGPCADIEFSPASASGARRWTSGAGGG